MMPDPKDEPAEDEPLGGDDEEPTWPDRRADSAEENPEEDDSAE
jgi:hypothetical protein